MCSWFQTIHSMWSFFLFDVDPDGRDADDFILFVSWFLNIVPHAESELIFISLDGDLPIGLDPVKTICEILLSHGTNFGVILSAIFPLVYCRLIFLSTCFVKIVDDDDRESGLLILACVYDDVLLEILSTCLLKFVDDDDSESCFLFLLAYMMMIYYQYYYFATKNFFLLLQIYIDQAACLLHY